MSGIPLLLCAGTYSLLKAFQETAPALPDHFWLYSGLTFGLAFLSLIFLMKYVRKHNLLVFALYRIILGFVLLL
ncbi:hypothetical protein AGMMS49949_05320 [Alphaproteobacteria bacterium]|nr:hypothetical protein AGMMS49949_05320 [Alphaproteobacteria bacterium]